ncbi:hypothetical protein JHK87_027923 [Glycine soja]|nr:hypothetical protein JHK87_027923 [Glycine soja]
MGKKFHNWDEKREEWLKLHPSFDARAQEKLFMVTGSQPKSFRNSISDHLLLRFFRNKMDYCVVSTSVTFSTTTHCWTQRCSRIGLSIPWCRLRWWPTRRPSGSAIRQQGNLAIFPNGTCNNQKGGVVGGGTTIGDGNDVIVSGGVVGNHLQGLVDVFGDCIKSEDELLVQ